MSTERKKFEVYVDSFIEDVLSFYVDDIGPEENVRFFEKFLRTHADEISTLDGAKSCADWLGTLVVIDRENYDQDDEWKQAREVYTFDEFAENFSMFRDGDKIILQDDLWRR